MKSLVIVAHGSFRKESNDEILEVADRVRHLPDLAFDEVAVGFLDRAEPLAAPALKAAIGRGATEIVVVPYFLAAGRHAAADVPAAVAPIQAEYPDIPISIASHLGAADALPQIIATLAVAEMK